MRAPNGALAPMPYTDRLHADTGRAPAGRAYPSDHGAFVMTGSGPAGTGEFLATLMSAAPWPAAG